MSPKSSGYIFQPNKLALHYLMLLFVFNLQKQPPQLLQMIGLNLTFLIEDNLSMDSILTMPCLNMEFPKTLY